VIGSSSSRGGRGELMIGKLDESSKISSGGVGGVLLPRSKEWFIYWACGDDIVRRGGRDRGVGISDSGGVRSGWYTGLFGA
jgi:hypothetical protein